MHDGLSAVTREREFASCHFGVGPAAAGLRSTLEIPSGLEAM